MGRRRTQTAQIATGLWHRSSETMFEVMGGVRELNFGKLGWGDAEIKALAEIRSCRCAGS